MGFSDAKIVPTPPYTPPGSIGIREGFGPLELFQGFFESLRAAQLSVRRSFIFHFSVRFLIIAGPVWESRMAKPN